jgi:hypothetical protein
MKSLQAETWPRRPVLCVIAACLAIAVQASNECAPVTWLRGEFEKREALTSVTSVNSASSSAALASTASPRPVTISPLLTTGPIPAGQVNCRYTVNTGEEDMDINYYTCTALATRYLIKVETFFVLNPGLKTDCSNIQPDTDYCVAGCKIPTDTS